MKFKNNIYKSEIIKNCHECRLKTKLTGTESIEIIPVWSLLEYAIMALLDTFSSLGFREVVLVDHRIVRLDNKFLLSLSNIILSNYSDSVNFGRSLRVLTSLTEFYDEGFQLHQTVLNVRSKFVTLDLTWTINSINYDLQQCPLPAELSKRLKSISRSG